jgi:hypothetical protein
MTDVTGFGLLGHLVEMADGSGVTARIEYAVPPAGVEYYLDQGCMPGGTLRNFDSYRASWALQDCTSACCATRRPAAACWSPYARGRSRVPRVARTGPEPGAHRRAGRATEPRGRVIDAPTAPTTATFSSTTGR